MFPTWSEVLEVLRALGYEKVEPIGPCARPSIGRSRRAWPRADVVLRQGSGRSDSPPRAVDSRLETAYRGPDVPSCVIPIGLDHSVVPQCHLPDAERR